MKSDRIPSAIYRHLSTYASLLFKGMTTLLLIFQMAFNGVVVAQQTTIPEFMPHDPMTISDGCEGYISKGGGGSILESTNFVVIKRGTYEYSLKFFVNPDGIIGTAYSEGGEVFNLNDELIFVNSKNEKASFRIQSAAAVSPETNSMNASFALNMEQLKWLASAPITVTYLKNNIKNQMLKFTIDEERAAYFQTTVNCLLKMMQ